MSQSLTFESPPVREISLGVSFESLKALRSPHFGLFWSKLRSDFPVVEDKPPVFTTQGIQVLPDDSVLLPRVWLVHKSQNIILQLQHDRFWFNWRRMQPSDKYPGFEIVLGHFAQWYSAFVDFITSENVGSVTANGAELVYMNHILVGDGWNTHAEIGKVFPGVAWNFHNEPLNDASGLAAVLTFDRPQFNVRAEMKSGKEKEGEQRQLLLLELRARSKVEIKDIEAAMQWFSEAHSMLGSLFVGLTSDEVRANVWRQRSL